MSYPSSSSYSSSSHCVTPSNSNCNGAICLNPTLEQQVRHLFELYRNWYPTRANILVGTAPPTGAVPEREYSLFFNRHTGQVFYAADGGVWRLVGDIRGPTGGIGPTGPTGPSNRRRHGHYDTCGNDCGDYHDSCPY